jgi:V8-like Glu-specific endopeptidase
MKKIALITIIIFSNIMYGQSNIEDIITNASRESCVKIISKQGNSSGTGFFISENIIASCFHVIANISKDSLNNINFQIFQDLQAINEDGDIVSLTCISIPTNASPEPFTQDFALLKITGVIKNKSILPLETKFENKVSDLALFSGYPLGTPTIITHFGAISGITKDSSIVCVQASTNKGNSGGALINAKGNVIGIISMREGGISLGLQNYLNQIKETEKHGSIQLMGVDPLQLNKETILVLDKYISTGIGYARNIKFLNEYIEKYKIKLE